MTAQPLPCLFDLTPDSAKLRDIARRQVRVLTAINRQQAAPKVATPQPSPATPTAPRTGGNGALKWNQYRHKEAAQAVLDQLDTPKTGRQIAEALHKSDSAVYNILKRLEQAGNVAAADSKQSGSTVWHRVAALVVAKPSPAAIASRAKGDATRKAVLEAVAEPATVIEVARHLGKSENHERDTLKAMEREGIVVRRKGAGRAFIFQAVRA